MILGGFWWQFWGSKGDFGVISDYFCGDFVVILGGAKTDCQVIWGRCGEVGGQSGVIWGAFGGGNFGGF